MALVLDGTGNIPESQFTAIHNGAISDEGGNYSASSDFSNLKNVDGSTLSVRGGGKLVLSGVLSFDPAGQYRQFSADGSGSLLSLPNLSSISTATYYGQFTIQATKGGDVELAGLASIDTAGYYVPVSVIADGTDSVVDLATLTEFNVDSGGAMTATDGGTIEIPLLNTANGVTVTVDASSDFPLGQFTSITNGEIVDLGVVYSDTDLLSLQDVDGSSLSVQDGGSLPLLSVATFGDSTYNTPQFSATGGSSLDLSGLGSISTPYGIEVSADGTGSVVDLSGISSWTTTYSGGSLAATTGGTIDLSSAITSLDQVSITVDGLSTLDLTNLQSLTDSSLTVNGGTYSLAGLSDLDGTELTVEGGATLDLQGVLSYSNNNYSSGVPFDVSDGSTLDLSQLASISQGFYGLGVTVTGSGSVADLTALSSWTVGYYYGYSFLSATGGGTIDLDPSLSGFNQVDVTVDSATSIPVISGASFTSLTTSTLTVDGTGTVPLDNITDFDSSSVYVGQGAYLSLHGLGSYNNAGYITYFNAEDGSTIDLGNLGSLTGYYGVDISANGPGSVVNLSSLTSIENTTGTSFNESAGGVIELPASGITSLSGVTITLSSDAEAAGFSALQSLTDSSLTVIGITLDLAALTDIDDSTFSVQSGGDLEMPAVNEYTDDNY